MDELPPFYRGDFLILSFCFEDAVLVLDKKGRLLQLDKGRTPRVRLRLGEFPGLRCSLAEYPAYVPGKSHFALWTGREVIALEQQGHRFKIVANAESTSGFRVRDVSLIGRPSLCLGSGDILDIRRGSVSSRSGITRFASAIGPPQIRLSELTKITQKLLLSRPLTPGEVDLLAESTPGYRYLFLSKPDPRSTQRVVLLRTWSLVLDRRLLLGVRIKNESRESFRDIEFTSWNPGLRYSSVFFLEKSSRFSISSVLPPESCGTFALSFDIEILSKANITFSGIITSRGTELLNSPCIKLKTLDILTKNEHFLKTCNEELVLSLMATSRRQEIVILDHPTNRSDILSLLRNIGFEQKTENYFILHSLLLVEIDSVTVNYSEGASLALRVYTSKSRECDIFVRHLKTSLSEGGHTVFPKRDELFTHSVKCMTRELKVTYDRLMEDRPRLHEETAEPASSSEDLTKRYLQLIGRQKCTDVIMNELMNLKP